MTQKYPVGIQDFSELRTNGYLYVDKTAFVYKLINEGKYYFLSRPRRFGKSLFVSTLDYLFKAKKELFNGLFIEDKWDWSKTNPVIKISFSSIGHHYLGLKEAISQALDKIADRYQVILTATTIDQKFQELIQRLSETHGKVVVLIDEYDKPIIDYLGQDTAKAIENQGIMKVFYSILKDADPYLKFVFITGVSKFSRVSIFSDLNNITDLTIDKSFSSICGITQKELDHYFSQELPLFDKEEIKNWYNGYSWDLEEKVYNPYSLLHFFREGEFKNFWFETGTPTFLINLSKKALLYDFENREVTLNQLSSYDIEKLQLLPLMFQTGYLTLKSYDQVGEIYTLGYPNKEVRKSYLEVLANSYIENDFEGGVVLVNEMRKALLNFELDKLKSIINSLFKSIPYTIWQNENEHSGGAPLYHAILHLVFSLMGVYVDSEVQTADGRMDALVRLDNYVYCFEFKLDGSADLALQQIREKGYLLPYLNQGKPCIAIGVNFSKKLKNVEAIKWQTVA